MEHGIQRETIERLKAIGVDFGRWLAGFDTVEQSVVKAVDTIRQHPLIPANIKAGSYVMDSSTGRLGVI